jgi:hypothetical protein
VRCADEEESTAEVEQMMKRVQIKRGNKKKENQNFGRVDCKSGAQSNKVLGALLFLVKLPIQIRDGLLD